MTTTFNFRHCQLCGEPVTPADVEDGYTLCCNEPAVDPGECDDCDHK